MAQFGKDFDNFSVGRSIKISGCETTENFTIYVIQVCIGPYTWTVKHRYSDFHELHEKLCSTCKLDKNLLPPKKLFGNQSESFIKKRQADLEVYLQTVMYCVSQKMPACMANFLDFSRYEIHGITQVMAEELYNRGDALLHSKELYKTTPLQLNALTERLKLPEPTCESGDVKKDIGHILDFITRLKKLQVVGGQTVGNSDIDVNQLQFDLTLFKSLQTLEFIDCDITQICGLETVKQTLQTLVINKSLKCIRYFLLQDMPHWRAEDGTLLVSYWDHIRHVDLSRNSVSKIDDSMQLMPKVVYLDLSHNQISTIEHLHWLSHMTYLDLSHNAICHLEALHSKLGNLKTLKLAGNKLTSLQGLSKLFSLEHLDVSYNQVAQVDDIQPVSGLPCVENLSLLGNPVTITLDYRKQTLAMFGERVGEVVLDGEKANQSELDTVAILQAIQKSKEKAKQIKKAASNASITDVSTSPAMGSLGPCHDNYLNSPGNQEGQATPLVQKYNLFTRKQLDSSATGVIGSTLSASLSLPIPSTKRSPSSSPALGPAAAADTSSSSSTTNLTQGISMADKSQGEMSTNMTKIQGVAMRRKSGNGPSLQKTSSTSSIEAPLPSGSVLINAAQLPNHTNTDFYTWLHVRLFGEVANSSLPQEQIKYVLWCPVVQYSKPDSQLPCCVVLTERRIFILQLKNGDSAVPGVPALETFYILPLCNIQQVLVGLCHSYIRLEESFVGQPGTFALLAPDSETGKEFYDTLITMSEACIENGELDVVNENQNSTLSKQLIDHEEALGECTGRIALAAPVVVEETGQQAYLVLSENRVYIVKNCVFFFPKPTFDTSETIVVKTYEIAQQFSVEGQISEINMFPCMKINQKLGSYPVTPTFNIGYLTFGLSMVFHELLGSHTFSFCFLSNRSRDTFLDNLTNLRSEHAHRMSPTIREEPEGGNELSKSSEEKQAGENAHQAVDNVKGKVTTCESGIADDELGECEDSVISALPIISPSPSQRKLRSKTEIVISRSPRLDTAEERDVPSYTWHYLSPELIQHLEHCMKKYTLFQRLSQKLQTLIELTGEQVAQFFHTNIVPVGQDGEELHHIMWTNVIPYTNPLDEVVTCVMLSNRAVYFVSDRTIRRQSSSARPSWMTHARHVSDSVIGLQAKMADVHHSSGILLSSEHEGAIIKPYYILEYSEMHQINVGLFDQCIRLTGSGPESVFTLATRCPQATSLLIKNLSAMLSLYIASPMLDKSSSDLEQDFYKAFDKRTKTTIEGIEYQHPSKVKFCYPGDEALSDLMFLMNEHLKQASLKVGRENILQYVLVYTIQSITAVFTPVLLKPLSLVVTNECFCFIKEDLISYPLPDFVRGLPSTPRHQVVDVRKIEYLKTVKQSKEHPRDLILVFSDEKEDIVIVLDHYSEEQKHSRAATPEVSFRVLIQDEREFSKFLNLIQSQWKLKHPESVHDLIVSV